MSQQQRRCTTLTMIDDWQQARGDWTQRRAPDMAQDGEASAGAEADDGGAG